MRSASRLALAALSFFSLRLALMNLMKVLLTLRREQMILAR